MRRIVRNKFAAHVDRVTTVPVSGMLHPVRQCFGCRELAYSGRHAKACPTLSPRRV
jgi:hypothetical protein